VDNLDKDDIQFFKKVILLIILLTLSLSYLYINKSQSYERYERISFISAGVRLYANLYYPSKDLEFQDNRPLIIYCHGIGSQRDFDLRIPIEFTKRGFYVAALDYQGHGESGGKITNYDTSTNTPALAEDCSKLLDKLETLDFYINVNTSQIGLIGHSMGGLVVLMNQALDSRFNVTVAWAPLVNFDPQKLGFDTTTNIDQFVPANLLNESNTNNLLVIMHVNDEALNFSTQALKLQELTNCTLISITDPVFGSPHQLFMNRVLIDSIKWFEINFFYSDSVNGPIKITFLINYIAIFISLGLLFLIILLLISYSAKFFAFKKEGLKEGKDDLIEIQISKSKKLFQIIKILFYIGIFIINWEVFENIFGILGIFLASLNISVIYILIVYRMYIKKLKLERKKFNFKKFIKKEFSLRNLAYPILCNLYFIGIYVIFSFFYPFAFIWPSNYLVSLLLAEIIFPIYFSLEILYRKLIYPQLNFIQSERRRSYVIIALAIYVQFNLISLTSKWAFFPSVIFTYMMFLVVIIQNTLIFERTKVFSSVILSSFDIVQLFFASVISNAFGIGTALYLFVGLSTQTPFF